MGSVSIDVYLDAAHPCDRQQRLAQRLGWCCGQQEHAVRLRHGPLEPAWRIEGQPPPVVEDGHALAEQRRLGQHVRAQQHGMLHPEGTNQFACVVELAWVQPDRGLVQQQHLRLPE